MLEKIQIAYFQSNRTTNNIKPVNIIKKTKSFITVKNEKNKYKYFSIPENKNLLLNYGKGCLGIELMDGGRITTGGLLWDSEENFKNRITKYKYKKVTESEISDMVKFNREQWEWNLRYQNPKTAREVIEKMKQNLKTVTGIDFNSLVSIFLPSGKTNNIELSKLTELGYKDGEAYYVNKEFFKKINITKKDYMLLVKESM